MQDSGKRLARSLEECGELAQQSLPLRPVFRGGEQAIFHVAQELHFHDVNFRHINARNFGPGAVGVGVVIEEFVSEHQSNGQQSIFASWLALYAGVQFLQAIDEEQGENDHVLRHQRGREKRGYPFPEARRGFGVRYERTCRLEGNDGIFDLLEQV